jgi:preprotein translocase subunit SecF
MGRFSKFGNSLYTGERSIDFVGRRKIWYSIAAVVLLLSVLLPALRGGFHFGIEFRGGSEFRVSQAAEQGTDLAISTIKSVDAELNPIVTTVGAGDLRIQTEKLSDDASEVVRGALAKAYGLESADVSSSFIGASWGEEVTGKAIAGLLWFMALAAVLMALYFRTVKMSIAAMAALAHDLVATAGIYGALGFEVTPAAVIGFLTILGYSLYDTVVVFDKIRENTEEVEFSETATFKERVNLAINQTLVRSINTTIVAVLPVAAILFIGAYFLGAGTLRDISLALFIGMLVGTYSTIFIAAPLYSQLREGEKKFTKAATKVVAAR